MKKKTFVGDLALGMYVCELDRPWSKAPFEPPFEVQGFFVSSEQELAKVRELCEFVYVDDHVLDAAAGGDIGVRPAAPAGPNTPAVLPGREPSPHPRQGNVQYLPSFRYRAGLIRDSAGQGDLPARRNDYEPVTRTAAHKRFRRKKFGLDARNRPERVQHADAVRATQHVLTLCRQPARDERVMVYADQCTMEEELTFAQQIAADTESVYRRVLNDIQSGRAIDIQRVGQTVQGLVESVVRNPDALTWLVRLKSRRHYTYSHSMAVCVLALAIGRFLGLAKSDLQAIGMGTLLQDIGTLHVPKQLLNKVDKLTVAEMKVISEHVNAGAKMLKNTDYFPTDALDVVISHHERFDGSGYPRGMHGDMISPFSAIAGMADTYEAMTSQRPYRRALTSLETLTVMYDLRDKTFSSAMVEHLIHCVGVFPVGSFVLLNTGAVGVVVGRNRLHQLKPKVLPILDPEGERLAHAEPIDLAAQNNENEAAGLRISRVIDPQEYALDPDEFFA